MADAVFQNWLFGDSKIQCCNKSSRFSQEYLGITSRISRFINGDEGITSRISRLSMEMKKEVLVPASRRRGVAFSAKAGSWNKGASVGFDAHVIGMQ